jgi:Leucine-rich repeat (LRR) protein
MHRPFAISAILTLALAVLGCIEPTATSPDPAAPPEASFAEQANAVRAGASDQIRLDHTPVHDADLDQLDGLEGNLRRINLSRTDITDAGLARIAAMPKLIQLRLASNQITDAGLQHLNQLKDLRHLHLIDTPITDAGLDHLHSLKSLESLYLDGTRATETGMSRLVEALPGVHLHFDGGHHAIDPHKEDHPH